MAKVYIAYSKSDSGFMSVSKIFSSEKAYWKYKLMRLKKELASSPAKSAMFTDQSDKALLNILKIQKEATKNSLPYIFEVEK